MAENVLVMCAVCFVGTDPAARDSLNAGIAVLLGVTGVVLAAFGWFFIRLARRSRAADASLAVEPTDQPFVHGQPREVSG